MTGLVSRGVRNCVPLRQLYCQPTPLIPVVYVHPPTTVEDDTKGCAFPASRFPDGFTVAPWTLKEHRNDRIFEDSHFKVREVLHVYANLVKYKAFTTHHIAKKRGIPAGIPPSHRFTHKSVVEFSLRENSKRVALRLAKSPRVKLTEGQFYHL